MNLWKKITGELVDVVEHLDNNKQELVHRFVRPSNEIKQGARLIVREGQTAVFVREGKIADVFEPGTYVLKTGNLPLLSTLAGWAYGFKSPIKAEVYFVSARVMLNQQWGTTHPITLNDPRFGLIEVRAFGSINYKIFDSRCFLREIVGSQGVIESGALNNYVRSLINARLGDAFVRAGISANKLAGELGELSTLLREQINTDLLAFGIQVTQFYIENLSLPPNLRNEIFEYDRLQRVDLNRLTAMKTAKAIENISRAETGGIASIGPQLAAGHALTQQMISSALVPPPLPIAGNIPGFHVALAGQTLGPFSREALNEWVVAGKLRADTLVWHPTIPHWQPAGSVPELVDCFRSQTHPTSD